MTGRGAFAAMLLAATPAAPLLAAPAVPANGPGAFAPRDECAGVPGAREFVAALGQAVGARDARALVALAARDVQLDFGGGAGQEELHRRLTEGDSLWVALQKLWGLGCAATRASGNARESLTLPWLFAQDLGDLDPFSVALVLGRETPVLAAPRAGAKVAGRLSWQLVELGPRAGEGGGFAPIRLVAGRLRGFVAQERLRSPVDYRLIAERRGSRFVIVALLAGD